MNIPTFWRVKMEKIVLTLEFTEKELELFENILICYQDEGPVPSGWQSPETSKIVRYVIGKIRPQPY